MSRQPDIYYSTGSRHRSSNLQSLGSDVSIKDSTVPTKHNATGRNTFAQDRFLIFLDSQQRFLRFRRMVILRRPLIGVYVVFGAVSESQITSAFDGHVIGTLG